PAMQKKLNLDKAKHAITAAGLTQSAIARHLDVSKEAVSQWLNEKSFPRPNKLLQLGKLLGLGFDELVIKDDPYAPQIAFRKTKGTTTTDRHIEKAQETGRFLRHLVPYLPFDTLEMPPILKAPQHNYEYLNKVASKVRRDINASETQTVDFIHLIRRFSELQAVIVPVLWGSKNRHENAIHIYLPDSQSTWVYLNLDVNIHDFKFWMAHELGHCLSPSLSGENAENFADDFAGALLFPTQLAEQAYSNTYAKKTNAAKIEHLLAIAEKEVISPYTVIAQINKCAVHSEKQQINLTGDFDDAVAEFNTIYSNLSTSILGDLNELDARKFVQKTKSSFETPFFDLLRQYLKDSNKGSGYVQSVTDMSLLDARSIYSELT
ncbi:MAG: transcriptional regulator with XRE-family HTH domain, partial [Phenylobacterium sp.]